MLVWSLVALLAATLHVAKAYPTPSSPQYSPFGKHGGIAAKVRAYNHNSGLCFPTSFSIGCGMLRDRSGSPHPRWNRGRRSEFVGYRGSSM